MIDVQYRKQGNLWACTVKKPGFLRVTAYRPTQEEAYNKALEVAEKHPVPTAQLADVTVSKTD